MSRETAPPQIFKKDGTLSKRAEKKLVENGLTQAQGLRWIEYGNYQGTILDMIYDKRCPAHDAFQKALKQKGTEGVSETFGHLQGLGAVITDQTPEEIQKKNKGAGDTVGTISSQEARPF